MAAPLSQSGDFFMHILLPRVRGEGTCLPCKSHAPPMFQSTPPGGGDVVKPTLKRAGET
jgi:hypothetical protein